jgi:hypothetical protein
MNISSKKQLLPKNQGFYIISFMFFSFMLVATTSVPIYKSLIALCIIWISICPLVIYIKSRKKNIPFFPLTCLFYGLGYGLPIFVFDRQDIHSFLNISQDVLTLSLLGLVMMILGFFISNFLFNKSKRITFHEPKNKKNIILFCFFCLVLYSLQSFGIVYYQYSLPHIINSGFYLSLGYLYYYFRIKLLTMGQEILFILFLMSDFLSRIVSLELAQLLYPSLFLILIEFYLVQNKGKSKKIISISFFMVLGIYFLLAPIKIQLRSQLWEIQMTDLGATSQTKVSFDKAFDAILDLTIEYHFNDIHKAKSESKDMNSFTKGFGRFSLVPVFERVYRDTPDRIPYWNGASYAPLVTSFIPRAIWKNKPIHAFGNKFGRRYGYVGRKDYHTSFNIPWLVELYANFGDLGVIFGMYIFGMLYGLVDQKLNGNNLNYVEYIFYLKFLLPLTYQESNFTGMIGGLLPGLILFTFVFKRFVFCSSKNQKLI